MTDGVNIDGLRSLYRSNPTARAFLDHAADRERDRAETTVERTQAILRDGGRDTSRGEIVELFQKLEQLACGKFIVGRWNKHSRFAWSVSIVSVGKAAAGEQQAVSPIQESEPESQDEAETLEHSYHLRPELCIEIKLPVDLTEQEARRLADFIRTLPLDRDEDA
jgi:hypothetical protein